MEFMRYPFPEDVHELQQIIEIIIADYHLNNRPQPPRRSRSKTQRQPSGSNVPSSTASPSSSDRAKATPIGRLGVCALDVKARRQVFPSQ